MINSIIKMLKNMKTSKIDKVLKVAEDLCVANNTVTTLEIKNELRKQFPNKNWRQNEISQVMIDANVIGKFDYIDNGTFRTYSLVGTQVNQTVNVGNMTTTPTVLPVKTPKAPKAPTTTSRISRTKALEIIQNSNGKFFTVTFIKKDGSRRIMNGQHTSNMSTSALGYINVKDISAVRRKEVSTVKSVNLQTIESITLNNVVYKVA